MSEYPEVVPPTVVVRAVYPGANPQVIAETVASPLEQQVTGVDMLYMFSQATADGVMTLTVTFALGTDLDNAQVQVQNRVSQTLPRLPAVVQQIGVTTEKAAPEGGIGEEQDVAGASARVAATEATVPPLRAAIRRREQRLVTIGEQAMASARAADLARMRYREGAADFLSLLDAERTQLEAEDALARAEVGVFTSVVAVYKALGGIPALP